MQFNPRQTYKILAFYKGGKSDAPTSPASFLFRTKVRDGGRPMRCGRDPSYIVGLILSPIRASRSAYTWFLSASSACKG